MTYEVVVIGAGFAGLAAALSLGRGRRRVLVVDGGPPRNVSARALHGFPTREGLAPLELLQLARQELARYAGIDVVEDRVRAVRGDIDEFIVEREQGEEVGARRVLLCVGLEQQLPRLPGSQELWGKSVFLCPFCHGFEVRDRELGYLPSDANSLEFALLLLAWSRKVHVFTDGAFQLGSAERAQLEQRGIAIHEQKLAGVEASEGHELVAVRTAEGDAISCQALFVDPSQQQTRLVRDLQLTLDDHGSVLVDPRMETSRPGVSAAGDLATPVHLALTAAAAGTVAGNALVRSLMLGSG